MSLRGRPKGKNKRQERVWTENEEKIVYALMDRFPGAARLKYLEEKTDLSRRTLTKHLDDLKKKGVVKEDEDGVFRLNPILYIERRNEIPKSINISNIEIGTLVVRAEAINPFSLEVSDRNGLLLYNENNVTQTASTISFNTPITIKFSKTRLEHYQIMVFPYES